MPIDNDVVQHSPLLLLPPGQAAAVAGAATIDENVLINQALQNQ